MATTTAAQTAANSNATMEGQYSFVQDLVGTVPELAQLLQKASAQGATADAFQAMLEATNWWRTNADTARQQVALESSDPATYQQNLTQAQQHVSALAAQMGVTLTPSQVASYATADLFQGQNDDQLKASLGANFTVGSTASTGDAAEYAQQLSSLAASYGVPVTQTWTNNFIQTALTTGQSESEMLAGATQSLINSASTAYPTLAQQLQAGQTTSQIAQPYIAAMASTLEIPEGNIQLTDPTIQQALNNASLTGTSQSGKSSSSVSSASSPSVSGNNASSSSTANVSGQTSTSVSGATNQPGATSMPLYQFNNLLRSDPRWQQTDNAKQSAYSMVASLGKSFGFAS